MLCAIPTTPQPDDGEVVLRRGDLPQNRPLPMGEEAPGLGHVDSVPEVDVPEGKAWCQSNVRAARDEMDVAS